ncbi:MULTISPECIES: hypothetical protein [unclassified Arthrobacter]|uniref:hypothetical protein n=1 Tax=unclassified Arthrobacter TaxID=235627 RepID=UPI001E54F20F|nr:MULTISPECIES: hypothetical protein [unclassified Arthrobacter]MCC9146470.1 hypothetical protein [Arthrobacter sp. zg-Y919]MDK1277700.1 hypothetical protein [Arthrobacter sp. zg.Y919]WIB02342.1 hypothetical protein QNO10_10260 [Arthrobacter sp. zg-Y919]
MSGPDPSPDESGGGGPGSKGLSGVGVSSLIAAASGYFVLFIAARVLDKPDNAAFLTYWAALFFVIGILSGIINETTRAVSNSSRLSGPATGPPVLAAGLGIGAAVSVAILATAPLWADMLFADATWLVVVGISVTAIAYAGHASLAGAAGGQQRWSLFARLAGLEALIRLAVVAAVALLAADLVGIELACMAGAFVWIAILLLSPGAREAAGARSDVPARELLGRMGHSLVSAAATATLITGYPIMLKLTTPGAEYALAAPLILAISLTRAPIMLPLQAFQAVLITHFVNATGDRAFVRLLKLLGLILAVGAVGAGLAAWLGPTIMLIFGPDYSVDPLTMAALTFGAALMAALTLTGTLCLAFARHRLYALGWVVATAVAFAALLLDLPLLDRVYISLLAGPLAGTLVHAFAFRGRAMATPSNPSTESKDLI